MDNLTWTRRIKRLPTRVVDHPMSGAYAAWVSLANVAAVAVANGSYDTWSLGAVGALGLALTAGRKLVIKKDVLGKTKRRAPRLPEGGVHALSQDSINNAFNTLYKLDSIVATRGLIKALPVVAKADGNQSQPWGVVLEAATKYSKEENTAHLVDGALYFAMREPTILTGKLSAKVQAYIIEHHPAWVAQFPTHFSRAVTDRKRPGLMDVAVGVYALHLDTYSRQQALQDWLENRITTNLALRNTDTPSA